MQLRGKVVLVDFWTYDCINCRNSLPHVNEWAQRYADQGLVVIGVHTPEYPFERVEANVRQAIARLGIRHPVATDNQYRVWRAFDNQYWPAHYFIDARGASATCMRGGALCGAGGGDPGAVEGAG